MENNIETFNSCYDIGYEGYIVDTDKLTINKIRIGEVRVCKLSNSEEYGYELLEDTHFGFIDNKYSYKPFDSLYSGSYRTCLLNANDIFESVVDIKIAIRNYVEERSRTSAHRKVDIINPLLNVSKYETNMSPSHKIGDNVFVEDIFGSEIISATVSDYMLIKQESNTKLMYVLRKSNGDNGCYGEDGVFASKDRIFNKRATEYFNKFKIS